MSPVGTKIWNKRYGGSLNDHLFHMAHTPSNPFLLGGHSESTATGDKTDAIIGGLDYWRINMADIVPSPCPQFHIIQLKSFVTAVSFCLLPLLALALHSNGKKTL